MALAQSCSCGGIYYPQKTTGINTLQSISMGYKDIPNESVKISSGSINHDYMIESSCNLVKLILNGT